MTALSIKPWIVTLECEGGDTSLNVDFTHSLDAAPVFILDSWRSSGQLQGMDVEKTAHYLNANTKHSPPVALTTAPVFEMLIAAHLISQFQKEASILMKLTPAG